MKQRIPLELGDGKRQCDLIMVYYLYCSKTIRKNKVKKREKEMTIMGLERCFSG